MGPNSDEEDDGLVEVDEEGNEEVDKEPGEDDHRAGPGVSAKRQWELWLVALVAVAALAGAVVLFATTATFTDSARPAPDGLSKSQNADVASAHDEGSAAVVTEDPTCSAWMSINHSLAYDGQGIWNDRDRTLPASSWNDTQRMQFAAAARSMRDAAAQTVGLARLTPHRVMRELYEQFIAYAHAYAARVAKYKPADEAFAGTANSAASALGAICAAIADGSASMRGPLVPAGQAPPKLTPTGNLANPLPFLARPRPACGRWKSALDQFAQQTAAWQHMNPGIPAVLWDERQKATNLAAAQVMNVFAGELQSIARESADPTWQDFADLAAAYRRAFVAAVPTYSPPDNHLANAANYLSTTVLGACAAVEQP